MVMVTAPLAIAEPISPRAARDFQPYVGVNTHLNYLDGAYAKLPKVADALNYLGVDHIRDATPMPDNPGSAPLAWYDDLLSKGVHMNFVAPGGVFAPGRMLAIIEPLAAAHRGQVDGIEGPNEVDHIPVSYGGQTGDAGALAAQIALYKAVKASRTLKGAVVYDVSGIDFRTDAARTSFKRRADVMNFHVYAQNGNPPGVWFREAAEAARPMAFAATEFGYSSMGESGWVMIGVDEKTQAKGLLNGLLDGFSLGFTRTYLYELVDEKPDPESKEREMHFGLFDNNFHPKTSAQALHNLIAILQDQGAARDLQPVDIAFSGLPGTARRVVLLKADGTILIVLWNEVTFWDRAAGTPIESAPVPVGITLSQGLTAKNLYDPLKGSSPLQSLQGKAFSVDLPDHPIIVEATRQ